MAAYRLHRDGHLSSQGLKSCGDTVIKRHNFSGCQVSNQARSAFWPPVLSASSSQTQWLQVGARRSHLIVLTKRGIAALEELGICIQLETGAACPGTVTQQFGSRRRRRQPAEPGSLFCFHRQASFSEEACAHKRDTELIWVGGTPFHYRWTIGIRILLLLYVVRQ